MDIQINSAVNIDVQPQGIVDMPIATNNPYQKPKISTPTKFSEENESRALDLLKEKIFKNSVDGNFYQNDSLRQL